MTNNINDNFSLIVFYTTFIYNQFIYRLDFVICYVNINLLKNIVKRR